MCVNDGEQKFFSPTASNRIAREKFILRDANAEDVEFLFVLRNDPVVRKASFNEKLISWEEHMQWFNRSSDRNIYVIEYDNLKVGQVRIDCKNNVGEVDISLITDFRGKGIGKAALINSCNHYFSRRPNVNLIYAHIKNTNAASIVSFLAAGFCITTSSTKDAICSEFFLARPSKQTEGWK